MRGWTFLVILSLLASGCGGGSDGPSDPGPGAANTVAVRNNSYSPASLSVVAGTTVTWAWAADAVQHTVTFNDGPTSPVQSSGTFPRTFASAGTYPYLCTVHGAAMSGTVTVTAAGSPGSGGGGGGGGGGYGSP